MDNQVEQIDVEKLVRVFRKIRDKRKEHAKAFKVLDAGLKAQQELVANNILDFLNHTKQTSAKTADGTAYKKSKVLPSCGDWGAFYTWIAEKKAFHFLHKRITIDAVTTYEAEHAGELPPGVNVMRSWTIGVLGNDGKDEGDD
jgi:hypothetical protein